MLGARVLPIDESAHEGQKENEEKIEHLKQRHVGHPL